MRKLLALATSLTMLFVASWAAASEPIVDAAALTEGPVSLTEYLTILDDPSGRLTLHDVQQPDLAARFAGGHKQAEALMLGFTDSAIWLRLQIRNASPQELQRMLEIALARHSSVQFFYPVTDASGTHYKTTDTGYSRPFAERAYPHRFFVFPLSLPANSEQVVFLRFQGPDGMDIPAYLWTPTAFHQYERDDYALQFGYLGMVLSMIAFNLLLGLALRDFNYLLYVFFVSCVALNISAANGVGFQYFWGNSPEWAMKGTLTLAAAALSFLILFMRRLLDTVTLVPLVDRWLKLGVAIQVGVIAGLWFAFPLFLQPALLSAAPTTLLILLASIAVSRHNKRSAMFFLAAFGVICIAGIITILHSFALLPTNAFTTNCIQIGSIIEMILLAFALADRYSQLRRDKENAQHLAIKAQNVALAAEQRIVETLRQSERLLEDRVDRRTAELSSTIKQLKQTQTDLVQAEKLAALGSLVAGVAHELNTPIGNALTTASALEDASGDFRRIVESGEMRRSTLSSYAQSAGEMSALVVKSCRRAATLIASFKQVAVDQTSEQRRQFDLRTLIEDNIAALRPGYRHLPWKIVNEVPAGLTCDSYPGGLGQVIACLVQNAVTHAFDGRDSGVMTLSAHISEQSVELLASDDGKGMSAQVLGHIFEPFYTSRLGQGHSGLGLSIALNIVTGVLGGTLSACSDQAFGTRFLLKFPQVAPVQS